MVITLNISDCVARHFGDTPDSIARNLLLKAALEDYREGRISEGRFAEILGISHWDAQEILDQHNARRPYTIEMLEEDRRNLDKVFGHQ
jgi:predicted HTH domain antitoxin